MANSIKIGSLDISSFKVGSDDCKVYLGSTLLYPQSPTPPTPTYEWKQYNEGDTVPSSTIYGVKLYGLELDGEIDFSTDGHSGVAFIFDTSSSEWTAIDLASYDSIDISEYFDDTEGCYIIYLSDLGYGGLPINYPLPSGSFEFDVQLYEEHVPTLKWVTFSNGDTISSDLQIYGIKGIVNDFSLVFNINNENIYVEDAGRNKYNVIFGDYISPCYNEHDIVSNTSVEYTFSNVGCSDSYTVSSKTIANMSNDIQLLIYS